MRTESIASGDLAGSPEQPSAADGAGSQPPAIPRWPHRRLRARIIGTLAAGILRLLDATWRKDSAEVTGIDAPLARGERVVVVFWHGKFFPLFSLLRGRPAAVFASISLHGEIIAEICRWFGYDCVLIPDTGGSAARQTMLDVARRAHTVGVAVDGPLGPYHKVKRGAIDMAADSGLIIVPMSAACGRRWIDRRRWDLREVPGPFTELALAVGDPIRVPANLDSATRRDLRIGLAATLEELDQRAEKKLRRANR